MAGDEFTASLWSRQVNVLWLDVASAAEWTSVRERRNPYTSTGSARKRSPVAPKTSDSAPRSRSLDQLTKPITATANPAAQTVRCWTRTTTAIITPASAVLFLRDGQPRAGSRIAACKTRSAPAARIGRAVVS